MELVANDSMSPLATALAAFAASVTVVPVVEDTVPIILSVVTTSTVLPLTIHDGVAAKLNVELDVVVARAVIAVPGNDSASPMPTALAAFAVRVTVVPVVDATVPIVLPVVTS